ncbi:MAG TPA: potassium/proton antiporter [Thermoleophilaceae bacterium]|nr:potassium/proton antiporter [Thermoleophilaceae bacterium]
MSDGQLILVAGVLLAAGLGAALLAGRLRVPGLLLFLGLGMLIGSDGLGLIDLRDHELARRIGIIALAAILFEGGLTAGFAEIKPVLRPGVMLAVVGTLITAIITGLAAVWLFDLSTLEGLLLGASLSVTDGAAIFALLRGSTLRRRLARTLEAEAGLNDPIAILLVIGFIEWIEQPDYGLLDMVALFAQQIAIGLAAGLAVGFAAVWAARRVNFATAGLYPVASIAAAALAFGVADSLHGSGFLAVYLAGLVLGSSAIPARNTITVFHQGLAWVAQIGLFLTLGLLVFPSQLGDVWLEGTVLAIVMVLVARPVAVAAATAFDHFSARERIALGWAGLRGALPVVLATFAVIEDVPNSLAFFNIVFFAVVISTLVQGSTFEPLARALGLTTDEPALPRPIAETGTIRRLGAEVVEFPVAESDAVVGRHVRDLGLPRDALLNVIVRSGEAIPPRGSTRIEAGDRLHVLLRQEVARQFPALMERWQSGPFAPEPVRRPLMRGGSVIFSTRPWEEERDGSAAYPEEIEGARVIRQLSTRRDMPGALVLLDDGRYAITGPALAVGAAAQISRYARRRLGGEVADAERAWWQEVVGALAR